MKIKFWQIILVLILTASFGLAMEHPLEEKGEQRATPTEEKVEREKPLPKTEKENLLKRKEETKEREFQKQMEFEKEKRKLSDIKKEISPPQFLFPIPNAEIKGEVELKVKAEDAENVEFYLRNPSSLVEIYLGTASKSEGNVWKLKFNSLEFPNGTYLFFVKMATPYGEFVSPEVSATISNEVQKRAEKEMGKESKEKIEHLEAKEKEVQEIEKGYAQQVQQEIGKGVEKVKKEAGPSMVPGTEKEIAQEVAQISENVLLQIDKLKKVVEKETAIETQKDEKLRESLEKEKEQIKKELIQKAKKPLEKMVEKLPPEKKEMAKISLKEAEQRVEKLIKEVENLIKGKAKEKLQISENAFKDSDGDELSDWQEIALKTDLFNPDTDSDGFLDGVEVRLGYDPLKAGPADKVFYQDVQKFGKVSERLKVEKVEIVEEKGKKVMKISGKAIPQSFVTVYIFSSPLVVMAKANEQGIWEYLLDKPLPDGNHTVYAAYTNNRGEIEEKSSGYVFVKSGDKILRISELEAKVTPPPSVALQRSFFVLTLGLIALSLGIAFFIIGYLRLKKVK